MSWFYRTTGFRSRRSSRTTAFQGRRNCCRAQADGLGRPSYGLIDGIEVPSYIEQRDSPDSSDVEPQAKTVVADLPNDSRSPVGISSPRDGLSGWLGLSAANPQHDQAGGSLRSTPATLFTICVSSLILCTVCVATQCASAQPAERESTTVAEFRQSAAEYEMGFTDGGAPFQFNMQPVFSWTNPARTQEEGVLFVWTHNGRPEALGCCFNYFYNDKEHRKHELHSLATQPIKATIDGAPMWHPKQAGVTFKPIPDAPKPRDTANRNKLQVRRLSRRFSGKLIDSDGEVAELRLLPAPLITYEPTGGECQFGAIFSLAYGTDPEIILLVESRQVDGKPAWVYAFARYHYRQLQGFLDGKQVWEVQPEDGMSRDYRATSQYRDSSYVTYHIP